MRRPGAGFRRLALGTGLLTGSWVALKREAVQRADVRLGDAVRDLDAPALDAVVTGTTDLGSMYGVLGAATVLAVCGRRQAAEDTLAMGTAAWVLAQTNKRVVRRTRPYDAEGVRRLIRPPTGSSFPSGHAAVGMAMMASAAERATTPARTAFLHGVGAYVAATRVYVGVHYPTDVVGGVGLGLILSGLWRGPLAEVGRGGLRGASRTARALAPSLRDSLAMVLGLRPAGAAPAHAASGGTPAAPRRPAPREPADHSVVGGDALAVHPGGMARAG